VGAICGWDIEAHGVAGQSTSHQNIGSSFTEIGIIFGRKKQNYMLNYDD
jgi:hypothetical protein